MLTQCGGPHVSDWWGGDPLPPWGRVCAGPGLQHQDEQMCWWCPTPGARQAEGTVTAELWDQMAGAGTADARET